MQHSPPTNPFTSPSPLHIPFAPPPFPTSLAPFINLFSVLHIAFLISYLCFLVQYLFSTVSMKSIILFPLGPFTLRSIEVGSIWDRSQFALRKCSHSIRSILDRSQFAFERSHSDRFGLRSISDRSNSLVWMAPLFALPSDFVVAPTLLPQGWTTLPGPTYNIVQHCQSIILPLPQWRSTEQGCQSWL